MLGHDVLDLVVADAVLAGEEDHAGGGASMGHLMPQQRQRVRAAPGTLPSAVGRIKDGTSMVVGQAVVQGASKQ